jgi:hypothetical protein
MNSEIEKEVLAEFKHIAKPMIEFGLYDSTRELVRDVTRDFIWHKIETYRMKLKDFEQKHHMTFTNFSKKLKKGASIAEEDEWMETICLGTCNTFDSKVCLSYIKRQ